MTGLSLGLGGSPSISLHFQGGTYGAAGHLISGGKLDVGRGDDLFFWSSPDFRRKIGGHAVCILSSVETAAKLLGFGHLLLGSG